MLLHDLAVATAARHLVAGDLVLEGRIAPRLLGRLVRGRYARPLAIQRARVVLVLRAPLLQEDRVLDGGIVAPEHALQHLLQQPLAVPPALGERHDHLLERAAFQEARHERNEELEILSVAIPQLVEVVARVEAALASLPDAPERIPDHGPLPERLRHDQGRVLQPLLRDRHGGASVRHVRRTGLPETILRQIEHAVAALQNIWVRVEHGIQLEEYGALVHQRLHGALALHRRDELVQERRADVLLTVGGRREALPLPRELPNIPRGLQEPRLHELHDAVRAVFLRPALLAPRVPCAVADVVQEAALLRLEKEVHAFRLEKHAVVHAQIKVHQIFENDLVLVGHADVLPEVLVEVLRQAMRGRLFLWLLERACHVVVGERGRRARAGGRRLALASLAAGGKRLALLLPLRGGRAVAGPGAGGGRLALLLRGRRAVAGLAGAIFPHPWRENPAQLLRQLQGGGASRPPRLVAHRGKLVLGAGPAASAQTCAHGKTPATIDEQELPADLVHLARQGCYPYEDPLVASPHAGQLALGRDNHGAAMKTDVEEVQPRAERMSPVLRDLQARESQGKVEMGGDVGVQTRRAAAHGTLLAVLDGAAEIARHNGVRLHNAVAALGKHIDAAQNWRRFRRPSAKSAHRRKRRSVHRGCGQCSRCGMAPLLHTLLPIPLADVRQGGVRGRGPVLLVQLPGAAPQLHFHVLQRLLDRGHRPHPLLFLRELVIHEPRRAARGPPRAACRERATHRRQETLRSGIKVGLPTAFLPEQPRQQHCPPAGHLLQDALLPQELVVSHASGQMIQFHLRRGERALSVREFEVVEARPEVEGGQQLV
eukprot:9503781-Pyramimonas_sp.AAC.1